MSSAYLRLLIFLPAILIPVCASSSLAFLMVHSAYKLNKQGDNIHPDTLFSGFKFTAPLLCPVALVASCLTQQRAHRSPRVPPSPSHGPALCPTHLLPSHHSLLLPISGLSAAPEPHHLPPTSSPFPLLFAVGSLHNCPSNVSAILRFIIRNICLVFVLIPGTSLLKPLEFPK